MLEWERGSSHQGGSWLLEEFLQVKRTLAVLCMNVNQSTEAPALLHTIVSVERRDIPKVCSYENVCKIQYKCVEQSHHWANHYGLFNCIIYLYMYLKALLLWDSKKGCGSEHRDKVSWKLREAWQESAQRTCAWCQPESCRISGNRDRVRNGGCGRRCGRSQHKEWTL